MDSESSLDVDCDSVSFPNNPNTCPLCNCQIKLYFINFTEKFLMCENDDCEFPFGHEDLQFVKLGNNYNGDDDLSSVFSRSTRASSVACSSVVSNIAWGEIEKMNRIYESEDSQLETRLLNSSADRDHVLMKSQKDKENDEELKKNIQNITQLTKELREAESNGPLRLQNQKWIQNLMRVQELSGVKLLQEEEIERLKKKEPELGLGELTIDLASKEDEMSCIKIKIANRTEKPKEPEN